MNRNESSGLATGRPSLKSVVQRGLSCLLLIPILVVFPSTVLADFSNSTVEGSYAFMDTGVITAPDDPANVVARALTIGAVDFDGEANSGDPIVDSSERLRGMDLGTGWGTCSAFDIVAGNPAFFRPNSWCVYKVEEETGTGTIIASLVNPGCSVGRDECNNFFVGLFVIFGDGAGFNYIGDGEEGGPAVFIRGVARRR